MSKKAVFLFFLILFSFVFYHLTKINGGQRETLGLKEEITFKKIRGFVNFYNFDYLIVTSDRIFLYINSDGLTSREIKDRYDCSYLINGGFYNSSFRPIGLLLSEGKENSSWQKNRLLNGVFSINQFGTSRITRLVPKDPLRIALQSGPLIFENGKRVVIKSSIAFERRVVLGVTGDNIPVFLVFWSDNNFFGGPVLEELPYLIEEINRNFGLNIADAINLDGGTASVFYGENISLSEASKVGSFFCVK